MAEVVVSEMDREFLALIRSNIRAFLAGAAQRHAVEPGLLLDIAPQVHEGARPFFPAGITVRSFDIDPGSGCTYIGDICRRNDCLAEGTFDYVVCTEVLEHTLQPFDAVDEILRILKPGGMLFLSVPFNFRIHGPLPDCWRFTEHGLRALLKNYDILELEQVETAGRPLMPVQYTVVALKRLG